MEARRGGDGGGGGGVGCVGVVCVGGACVCDLRGGVEVEVDVVNHIIFSTHVARGYVGFGAEGPGRRRLGSLARMASDQ